VQQLHLPRENGEEKREGERKGREGVSMTRKEDECLVFSKVYKENVIL